jgi:uncharacterized protein YbjT (DUF2867 family)
MSMSSTTSTTSKPIVVVCGATGAQGRSVARAFLNDGGYHVKCLTRTPSSDKAKMLAKEGCEVVRACMSRREDIKSAFTGAAIVFAVTNFDDPSVGRIMEIEVEQGQMMANIAKQVGVGWYVWSSLPDPALSSSGTVTRLNHFASKYTVQQHIANLGLPATFVMPAYYMSNSFLFHPTPSGQELRMPYLTPNSRLALLDVESDLGPVVLALAKDKNNYLGATIPIAGDNLTMQEIAEIITKETGVHTTFKQISPQEAARHEMLEEYIQMCQWFHANAGYYGQYAADFEIARKLHPKMKTFAQFLREQNPDIYFKEASHTICAPVVDFCRFLQK